MIRFSANLGYLFKELSLVDAIQAAKRAGFDAVECHFPFSTLSSEVKASLIDADLSMLSLNAHPGNMDNGELWYLCTARPGQ